VEQVVAELGVAERRACRVLGQRRSTQRKPPRPPDDEAALTAAIIALATRYGRYGYRRITALLRRAGWRVNRKRVERLWRREGLKVPRKQPKKGRLWPGDGSCLRLRPDHPNHVWSYGLVEDRAPCPPAAGNPSRSAEGRMALGGTDGSTACSTSSMNAPASAWRSG
jgi:putative transposase